MNLRLLSLPTFSPGLPPRSSLVVSLLTNFYFSSNFLFFRRSRFRGVSRTCLLSMWDFGGKFGRNFGYRKISGRYWVNPADICMRRQVCRKDNSYGSGRKMRMGFQKKSCRKAGRKAECPSPQKKGGKQRRNRVAVYLFMCSWRVFLYNFARNSCFVL